MGGHFYRSIFYYYGFQKKIENQINNNNKDREDEEIQIGYLINPDWIKEWKNIIQYSQMEKILNNYKDIDFSNINTTKKNEIKEVMKRHNLNKHGIENIVKTHVFLVDKILTIQNLQIFLDQQTFDKLKIKKTFNIQIEYF